MKPSKMKKGLKLFRTNPEKAASRVSINGVMLASLFVMLAVVFLEPEKFHFLAIAQMVLSIPLLFVSSLAYSKIGYLKINRRWDFFGYITLTFGNFFMINAIGLIASRISYSLTFIYFGLTIFLLLIYSIVQLSYHRSPLSQIFKFLLSIAIIFFGGILPLIWS